MAFKIRDYIFTPKDAYYLIKRADKRTLLGVLLLLGLDIILRNQLGTSYEALGFGSLIFAIVFWDLDSRIVFSLALFYLILIPLILLLPNQTFPAAQLWAQKSAVWAFYCLVIGVAKQLWEYFIERRFHTRQKVERSVQIITTIVGRHARFLGHQESPPRVPVAPVEEMEEEVLPIIEPEAVLPTVISKTPIKHKASMDGIVLKRKSIHA